MEDRLYKKEEYRGYTIKILYDYDAQSPREWDNLGTIYSNSRSYDPDGHSIEEIIDDETGKLDKEFVNNHIMLDIYAYEHGGITISTGRGGQFSDPWDSGLFGIIAMSKEDAVKNWGKKICTKEVREKALKCLEGEVETLNQYYTGDVYGYVIEDEDECEVDSCWGYYGSECIDKDVIPECKSIIDYKIENKEKLHADMVDKVKNNLGSLVGFAFYYINESFRIALDMFGLPVLQKAKEVKNAIREEYYRDVSLQEVPDDVLEDMVKLIA